MRAFQVCEGYAAPILRDNIDSELIIRVERIGQLKRGEFAPWAFEPMRYGADGMEDPCFVLNQPPFHKASILIAGSNFGCGSSGEMVVWALEEFGIRAIIAESYGDIFYSNCLKNGLLPVILDRSTIEQLARVARAGAVLKVDLQQRFIFTAAVGQIPFPVAELERNLLLEGLDEMGQTLEMQPLIDLYQYNDRRSRPWLYPGLSRA